MALNLTRWISLVLLVVWMCAIFALSAQTGSTSDKQSRGVAASLVGFVYPGFDDLSESQKAEITDRFFVPVRKAAHFTEYFILGAIAFTFFYTFASLSLRLKTIFSLSLGVLYAVSDELHQLFVDSRGCSFLDVCIDSAGVLLAVIAGLIIMRKKRGESVG